jgi:hypothetical protein
MSHEIDLDDTSSFIGQARGLIYYMENRSVNIYWVLYSDGTLMHNCTHLRYRADGLTCFNCGQELPEYIYNQMLLRRLE